MIRVEILRVEILRGFPPLIKPIISGDTYGATRINGLSFDVHYEIDSLGSENTMQKYI